ncbi:MAG: ATP-binding protein [Ferruginibacter sp.]
MLRKYFRYLLLATFFTAILLIVFLQFNSTRSINQLIHGNESLIAELRLKNELQQLQTDIVTAENRVKDAVIQNEIGQLKNLQQEVAGINNMLNMLDSMINDTGTDPLLAKLQRHVKQKIEFNYRVLDTFSIKGKNAAELLIDAQSDKHIIDSIRIAALEISKQRQETVTQLTRQADEDGTRAKTLGSILALVAALAAAFAFGYVSNRLRQQRILINQLNESEKKARDAVVVKENFMANMSHEIRTPMNAILGFTNLLQRRQLDNESKEYVQSIQRSGENLLTLVNDVLDFSKIEAGMMRIESAPFSINGLVHSVETMLQGKAKEKGLELKASIPSGIPDTLEGDANRLTQILVNLIGNAIKFTSQGSVHVNIKSERIHNNTVFLLFSVTDTGIGIEKEKQATVFGRFQQVENTVTRKYGGTGLGLSIVKELVALQHGDIFVESVPGKGSTFSFIIPYIISSTQFTKLPATGMHEFATHNNKHINVLVVEDNDLNKSLMKHLLMQWHLSFNIVSNGREAVDDLKENNYHLVLMDIQMPEMDGYTAAQVIRHELKSDVPIIAMTAHALAGEREKCLSFGMNEYLSKPIMEEDLYKLIIQFTSASLFIENKNLPHGVNHYKYINLDYLKAVSNGNIEYEKEVTNQFIETVPQDTAILTSLLEKHDYTQLKRVAHNLKTTVSVMGLTEKLLPQLDAIEYTNMGDAQLKQEIDIIKDTCAKAVEEAKTFLGDIGIS